MYSAKPAPHLALGRLLSDAETSPPFSLRWPTTSSGPHPGRAFPTEGTRRGKAEVAQFFNVVASTWSFSAFEPREYITSGDTVVVIGSYAASALATGASVGSGWVMVWKMSGGKITHFREHRDTQAMASALMTRAAAG